MPYGLLKYSTVNLGDEIQSLAARQFLPRVDTYLDRDCLTDAPSPTRIILNGWWMHGRRLPNGESGLIWPPGKNIFPLFVSFHIAPQVAEKLTSPASLAYLKRHEPIGCRDLYTKELLLENGVEAYFSGCLTLSFPHNKGDRTDNIYLVDIPAEWEERIPPQIVETAARISHKCRETNWRKRFQKAEQLLRLYAAARLVVTTRLHCALPCLAFGTPVVFMTRNVRDQRLAGLLQYLEGSEIDWECPQPPARSWAPLAARLEMECRRFVSGQDLRTACGTS